MSGLISVDEALRLLAEHQSPKETETLSLNEAFGRVLAADIHAKTSQPAAAVSAMDGYAVRLADVQAPGARLRVIGESPAGHPYPHSVQKGECVRIFTGGYLPEGTDHIVIQENTKRLEDEIISLQVYQSSLHVRKAGRDFYKGQLLMSEGARLHSGSLALLAAANIPEVPVYKKLRVGILANGDELKPVGTELKTGEIVNSNPIGLSALIRDWGGEPVDLGIATDSIEAIQDRLATSRDINIFLPVGGASVGDHDHMKPAFLASGFELIFSKIAVKPGKPTWFGRRRGALVLGLPGNPASAFVCAHLFLRPLLNRDYRHDTLMAELTVPIPENGPRESFLRSKLSVSQTGQLRVTPNNDQDSSLISPFLNTSALIRRPVSASTAQTGDKLPVILTSSNLCSIAE